MAVKCESGPRPAAHSAKRRFLNCLETSLTPSSTSKASLRDRSRRAKTPWQWSTDDVASATWMPGLGPLTRSPCCCLGSADIYIYIQSPLEFSLGNGDPGLHNFLEILVLGFSMFDNLHSLEGCRSLFDLIWWKLEVPLYRVQGYQPGSPLNFDFPFFRHQLCVSKKTKFHFLEPKNCKEWNFESFQGGPEY